MNFTRAAVGLVFCALAQAAVAQPLGANAAPDPGQDYVRPHQMVDIGGRRLNLFCAGSGSHTVLFDSGGGDWSATWALVHPAVAKRARACVYDRAGLGYSDPVKGPRSPVAIVEDMHQLIAAAGLSKPLVLVGHSLGGFNVKLYAALYPEDVAGMVLVDPADDRPFDRARKMTVDRFGLALASRTELLDRTFLVRLLDRSRLCAALAQDGDLDPQSDNYRRCTDPVRPQLGPSIAAERRRLQVRRDYQAAQASEILNSVFSDPHSDAVYAALFRPGVLGDRPLVVLTHGQHDAGDPLQVVAQAQTVALNEETARLSSQGRQVVVAGAGHNIQVEAPDAVVKAVESVLSALNR